MTRFLKFRNEFNGITVSDVATISRPLTLERFRTDIVNDAPRVDSSTLVQLLLDQQQQLSAVEQFSRDHLSRDHSPDARPDQAQYYSRLLPAAEPGPGQQYAFEVDLDRCSGCKACVTACHALNGLDEQETWRDVGLLVGGTESAPVMQHVTAACHHCLEPACMSACPVDAYEKDPKTGIVRHLDDQCFGCQYCTLACPYDVPKYHQQKGIVRKCDMCSNRLANGEAPACVQACPHEAIAIRIIETARIIENAEADHFLPAAPEPYLTLPTTTYRSTRVFPRNMLPADYYSVNPQHPHWPLIIMLVLTQLSVGAFTTGSILGWMLPVELGPLLRPYLATSALLLGLLALGASTLHLGRPQYAYRGLIGLRHSWLSREILAFGVFSHLAIPYAALCWLVTLPGVKAAGWDEWLLNWLPGLEIAVAVTGAIGVYCSVMIYAFTKRELWSVERTAIRFGLTSAMLGIATTWVSLTIMRLFISSTTLTLASMLTPPLIQGLLFTTLLKLSYDASLLRHLANFRNTPLKRSAVLVLGVLQPVSVARMVCGAIGGIAIPAYVLCQEPEQVGQGILLTIVLPLVAWTFCLLGELFERYLFFAAVSSPRMPGGLRT